MSGKRRKDYKKILKKQEEKDKATIITEIPEKTNRDFKIKFKCSCSIIDIGSKKIRYIIQNGGLYCKKCIKINKQEKMIETWRKNYGVDNPFQSEIIKVQIKQTNLKNLGVEYPMQNEIVKKKFKQKSLKNWGVEHPMQNEIIKEKYKETCEERYGVEYYVQSDEFLEKYKETSLKHWGVERLLISQNWMLRN